LILSGFLKKRPPRAAVFFAGDSPFPPADFGRRPTPAIIRGLALMAVNP
jgi:hypothetical protein